MNNIETLALANAVTDKQCKMVRAEVEPGQYTIDMMIHISGIMTVGADYPTTPTVSIPLIETIALLLKRMGFQRDKAMELLREIMTEAIELKGKGKGALIAIFPELESTIEQIKTELLSQLPEANRKGPVKFQATIVEPEPILT